MSFIFSYCDFSICFGQPDSGYLFAKFRRSRMPRYFSISNDLINMGSIYVLKLSIFCFTSKVDVVQLLDFQGSFLRIDCISDHCFLRFEWKVTR